MKHLSEFTDLTRAQVEALLECFDFLRNGYIQVLDHTYVDSWVILMKHSRNGNTLAVVIQRNGYYIRKNRVLQKSVVIKDTRSRYRLFVNSDMSVGVVRTSHGADVNSVSS